MLPTGRLIRVDGRGAGVDDALVARLTAGLPDNYLQALKELYVNFHGPSSPLPSMRWS
jgi:syntaxin-binding protein 1